MISHVVRGRRTINYVKFEVLMAVRMTMLFLVVMPCRLIGRYQYFGETLSPLSALKMETVGFSDIYLRVYMASQPRKTSLSRRN
jgi:hypothetical protein